MEILEKLSMAKTMPELDALRRETVLAMKKDGSEKTFIRVQKALHSVSLFKRHTVDGVMTGAMIANNEGRWIRLFPMLTRCKDLLTALAAAESEIDGLEGIYHKWFIGKITSADAMGKIQDYFIGLELLNQQDSDK